MSFVELKRAVDGLSTDERLELAEHLRQSFRANDPAWQAKIERRLDLCLQGNGHSAEELMILHHRLSMVDPLIQEAIDSGPEEALTRQHFDAARRKARLKFESEHIRA
jgi:hypothetical protein